MIGRNAGVAVQIAAVATYIAWAGAAAAQDAPYFAPVIDVVVTTDTDGFHASRARAGGLYPYANPWSYAGAAAQSRSEERRVGKECRL